MTVSGESSTAPPARDAADAMFTEIYAAYCNRVRQFIRSRLHVSQQHLAEDLANETFIDLWKSLLKGRGVQGQSPFPLLAYIARTKIAEHFKYQKNNEKPLDMADPCNRAVLEPGHSYAHGTPVLADLSNELDQAMDRMAAASELWRELHKEAHRSRRALSDGYRGGVSEDVRRRSAEALHVAERRQVLALRELQESCRHVGALRLELEAAGGANWKSSAGMPASVAKNSNSRETTLPADCIHGHRMDLNNTHFFADGSRRCRICMDTAARNFREKTTRRPFAGAAR